MVLTLFLARWQRPRTAAAQLLISDTSLLEWEMGADTQQQTAETQNRKAHPIIFWGQGAGRTSVNSYVLPQNNLRQIQNLWEFASKSCGRLSFPPREQDWSAERSCWLPGKCCSQQSLAGPPSQYIHVGTACKRNVKLFFRGNCAL